MMYSLIKDTIQVRMIQVVLYVFRKSYYLIENLFPGKYIVTLAPVVPDFQYFEGLLLTSHI